jgi:hypothetical protein
VGEDGSVPERDLEQGRLFKDLGELEQAGGRDGARDERVFEQFCGGRRGASARAGSRNQRGRVEKSAIDRDSRMPFRTAP